MRLILVIVVAEASVQDVPYAQPRTDGAPEV